ncbi:MAG TPA: DNA polymerase III subunit gamma/tau, partial [Membranihabitans sp.]|nr:DNA polymerase III subunit gamma/tau [Membranihabitans sp.]
MSQFIVSARKYRPQRFDEVVGQEHITTTLKNAIRQNKVAHAFLFCGPRGVGKTTSARILAKTINCENITSDFEACGECTSCVAFQKKNAPNIIELDAASHNSVDDIRNLNEQVRIPPAQGNYKLFIIDEVHMLSIAAFNAFLKTLEEPPPSAIFILATTEKHKILPTILSRCQIYDFKRNKVSDIVQHLEKICESEGLAYDREALHLIAEKADGALRDALSIFDRMVSFSDGHISYAAVIDQLNVLDYDYFFQLTDQLVTGDLPEAYLLFDQILDKGFSPEVFLLGFQEHLRQLLMIQLSKTASLVNGSPELQQRYANQSAVTSRDFLLTILD